MKIKSIIRKKVSVREITDNEINYEGIQLKADYHPIPHDCPYVADFPDIDTDFLPYARDEIKKYAAEKYGSDKVCTVGNWNTYKLKQALIDSCRIFEYDQQEILALTKSLNEDEYDIMDAKELCEHNPEFKQYYEINKEIVDLALELRGRIKSQGQHAGGIIISSEPLSDVVPMTIKNDKAISQWTEGMSATQLSPVGLVKFDILGLKTLAYNVYTEELIKQSTGIIIDWSECDPSCDEPYAGFEILPDGTKNKILFNDPTAIKMADEIKTEAVFQFDTHVAKGVLANGVTNFHDLVAYTALARPGPMDCIPEYIARRDDPKKLWMKKEDPRVIEMLEDTHGIICFHEDTLISMSDGSHKEIKNINIGDKVSCVNLNNKSIDNKKVVECKPTIFGGGIKITLKNGRSIIVTENHNILGYHGYIKASDINVGDLIAIPRILYDTNNKTPINRWLGSDNDVAYLIGQLIGDGCLTGSNYHIAVGNDINVANILSNWIKNNLNVLPRIYWHCRSYYISIVNDEKVCNEIYIDDYIDSKEWFDKSYKLYSVPQIATFIKKSNWYVYNKLSKYGINVTNKVKNPWKTKLHKFIENIGLNKKHKLKRIPNIIFNNTKEVKFSFLSGLIESDGCLAVNSKNVQICYISSSSAKLLLDIDRLCMSLEIPTTIKKCRIYLHNTEKLYNNLRLLYKSFNGKLNNGNGVYYVDKNEILSSIDISKREFSKKFGISRKSLRHNSKYFRYNTAIKAGYDSGDIRYSPVKNIEYINNCQFYNISVPPHHNVIANGIIAKQCYQEQLTNFWTKFGGLTVPEAEKARKYVAKKKKEEVFKLGPKIVEGMIRNGFENDPKPINEEGMYEEVKSNSAQGWWNKMVTFGRYCFNKCLSKYAMLEHVETKEIKSIEEWIKNGNDLKLLSFDETSDEFFIDDVISFINSGDQEVFEIEFDNGIKQQVTMWHKFMCEDRKMHTVEDIIKNELNVIQFDDSGRWK